MHSALARPSAHGEKQSEPREATCPLLVVLGRLATMPANLACPLSIRKAAAKSCSKCCPVSHPHVSQAHFGSPFILRSSSANAFERYRRAIALLGTAGLLTLAKRQIAITQRARIEKPTKRIADACHDEFCNVKRTIRTTWRDHHPSNPLNLLVTHTCKASSHARACDRAHERA